MKIQTKAVHAGDRRRRTGQIIPSTTPIHLSSTYFYDSAETLDRVLGHEEEGFCYSRYANPTNAALEQLAAELDGGAGALATASGMAAIQIAFQAALLDRPHKVVASHSIYGATVGFLDDVLSPFDVECTYVDICDFPKVQKAIEREKPGCVFIESISNPLLRVPKMREIANLAHAAGASFVVDNTFGTPLLMRPIEFGANMVVHSATKYLAGHGDVLGGLVVSDAEHHEIVRRISRIVGPVMGPFESYLTMRGMKTLPLRFERQCQNARRLAEWLAFHPCVDRVYYCADPEHPDAAEIKEYFEPELFGAILSFEVKSADRARILAMMNRLKVAVPGTSLGDVHTLVLYPFMASHRNVSPKMRERMGIKENLVRIAAGIEDWEDICCDLDGALRGV